MGFRISEITAFTSIDEDDEEGVCAFLGPDGVWVPMICADSVRLEQLRPMAHSIAEATGRPINEVKFRKVDE